MDFSITLGTIKVFEARCRGVMPEAYEQYAARMNERRQRCPSNFLRAVSPFGVTQDHELVEWLVERQMTL